MMRMTCRRLKPNCAASASSVTSAKISDFVNGVHDAESSLKAGLDMEMMFTMHYTGFAIKKLLKKGKLQQEHIDRDSLRLNREKEIIERSPSVS